VINFNLSDNDLIGRLIEYDKTMLMIIGSYEDTQGTFIVLSENEIQLFDKRLMILYANLLT
jgi:hypothetical protein